MLSTAVLSAGAALSGYACTTVDFADGCGGASRCDVYAVGDGFVGLLGAPS